MNVVLFGFKGSGKSHFGKLLAKMVNKQFIDTDLWVEDLYGKGLKCREIALEIGESRFRDLEKKVVEHISSTKNGIIALGGATILARENQEILQKMGKLIYLDTPKEILKKRILISPLPSFLDPLDPEGSFEKMHTERYPLYEIIGAVKISTDGKSEKQILDELIDVSTP